MAVLKKVTRSSAWCEYFKRNATLQRPIPWHLGKDASDEELARVLPSLRGWQLGETSDGSHLLIAPTHYALSSDDHDFIEAAKLFILEEQRHGENLGRFLDLAGIERARFDWGDTLFRSVRYLLPRIEIWATPVLMVETHAMIYYNALRLATGSRVLRAICRQILADEVPHIRFQCERLAVLHHRRPRLMLHLTHIAQRILFLLITLAVWVGHQRVLKAANYSFARFWYLSWTRMQHAWTMASPSAYEWSFGSPHDQKSKEIKFKAVL